MHTKRRVEAHNTFVDTFAGTPIQAHTHKHTSTSLAVDLNTQNEAPKPN